MPRCRRSLPLLLALALAAAPAVARAQSSGTPTLSPTPPVSLGSHQSHARSPTRAAPGPTTLPNTGADARVLGLTGIALLLLGIGLRLRTADERF